MLEDCLFASRPSARSKKPLTLVLSVITHIALASVLILIPLFQNQVLPQVPLLSPLRPPTISVRSVELVPASRQASASPAAVREPDALFQPIAIPTRIVRNADDPLPSNPGFLPAGTNGAGPFVSPFIGLVDGQQAAPPLPPPTPPAAPPRASAPDPAPTGPVRRGSTLMQSSLVYSVKPTYPRLAVITHVQGAVVIEAVITREGTIDPGRLRVLSGHTLLVSAAVEAVQQWRYRPTLLNGEPIEVLTTITVNFTLN